MRRLDLSHRMRPPRRSRHAKKAAPALRFETLEPRSMLAAGGVLRFDVVDQAAPSAAAALGGAGEIHGTKWSDLDGDGDRDPNEPGLAGVTIYLDANNDGGLNADELSTVTATDDPTTPLNETGAYEFTGLAAGSYLVREVVPTGYEQTFPLSKASQFNIDINFPDDSLTPAQQQIFLQAAARWQEIIIGDIPDVDVVGIGLVDDVYIEATGPAIDGRGGILGQAGPRVLRTGSSLPATGVMEFDAADIVELVNDGQFDEVILHEMGHVLGFGTIWDDLGLLTGRATTNPRFIGPKAVAQYNEIFGTTATSVPVEGDQGGAGTLYSHWDEETLDNELMTGFLNSGVPNPLSRITVGEMADLGYEVNFHAADDYTAPNLRATLPTDGGGVRGRLEILNLPRTFVEPLSRAVLPAVAEPDERFWVVELGDGETVTNVDFGNMPLPGSIHGRKWNDRDADGIQDPNEPGLADWTIFLDEDGDGILDGGAGTFDSADVPVPIPDEQTITSVTTVTSLPGAILDINVTIDVTHSYDADLTIILISPTGRQVTLAAANGSSGHNFTHTTFDDEAPTSITAGRAPFSGSYRPRTPLAAFDGELAEGLWTLQISDEAAFDVGTLEGWSLALTTGERSTVTNEAGDYAFEDLPAGDYTVAEVQQPDWLQTYPPAPGRYEVTLVPGQDVGSIDFGNRNGFIGGRVWNDYDGDGQQGAGEPPLPGWTAYLDQNNNGKFDDGKTTVASVGGAKEIVDLATITSQIELSGLGAINDLNVTVNIQHSYDSDLDVFLVSPQGTRIELFSDVGSSGDDFRNTQLDDEAATPITGGAAPFAGSFRPEQSLSTLDGEDPNGVWTLEISDDASSDVGGLLGWSLTVTTREQTSVTDGEGNFGFFDVPPGQYAVGEVVEAGWAQTRPAAPGIYHIVLGRGEATADVDFGNRLAAIRGQTWNDLNRDGVKDAGEPGLPGWIVYLDANANSVFDRGSTTTISNEPSRTIPDLGTLKSTLAVESRDAIDDLNVTLSITHSDLADLDVYLISPSGTRVELFTDLSGGGQTLNNISLDDEATQSIAGGKGPFAGSYRPEGLLTAFDGEDPHGVWTLEISDDAGNDVGTLKGWSLTISSTERFAATDDQGNYALVDLQPGAYVVRAAEQRNWEATYPEPSGAHSIALTAGEQRGDLNFGAHATALFGDFDHDGDIDGNDFLMWQRGLAAAATPAGSGADGDGDGAVDDADLIVWNGGFGNVLELAAVSALAPQSVDDQIALETAFAEWDATALGGREIVESAGAVTGRTVQTPERPASSQDSCRSTPGPAFAAANRPTSSRAGGRPAAAREPLSSSLSGGIRAEFDPS